MRMSKKNFRICSKSLFIYLNLYFRYLIKILFKVMWNTDIIFKHGYLMKIPIESFQKKNWI